jgi:UDP-N-acetyl-D-mannosaminuronic acid dehydrogenase
MKSKISIIGLGYIGLPFALLLVKKGFIVDGIDINKKKINALKKGKFISEEDEVNKIYRYYYKNKKINFSSKLKNSKFFILCLPTPLKKNFKCDYSFLINGINQISKVLNKDDTIIIESTVPIGTTSKLRSLVKKLRPEIKNDFNICFVPEKAIPGNTINEMQNNKRIIGADIKTFNIVKKIYNKISRNSVKRYEIEEAEASKLIENSFRDNQIAFSNFVDMELKKLNLNTKKIIEICNMHPRVNLLNPSIGVGGHCIPVDPYFLNFDKSNLNTILVSRKINDKKTYNIANKLKSIIKKQKGKIICLWGLGYKPGSTDIRESPSLKIINILRQNNFYVSDPNYHLLKNKKIKIKNFIQPEKAFKKIDLHIILNLEKKYFQSKFKNLNYIIAEDL